MANLRDVIFHEGIEISVCILNVFSTNYRLSVPPTSLQLTCFTLHLEFVNLNITGIHVLIDQTVLRVISKGKMSLNLQFKYLIYNGKLKREFLNTILNRQPFEKKNRSYPPRNHFLCQMGGITMTNRLTIPPENATVLTSIKEAKHTNLLSIK